MRIYDIPPNINQTFTIPDTTNGNTLAMRVYYAPLSGWHIDLESIKGVRAVPLVPIFKAYGREDIIVLFKGDEIGRDDVFQVALLDETDLEDYDEQLGAYAF